MTHTARPARLRCYVLLVLLVGLLTLANLFCGAVRLPVEVVWRQLTHPDAVGEEVARFIVLGSRLPAACTALLTGAALGVCGLLLQSYFRNPLAGPSLLGITSGANLGVACVTLLGVTSTAGVTGSALLGACGILALLLLLSRRIQHTLTLLIVGLLVSYLTGALITLLNYYATAEGVRSYLLWGMGNFNGVGTDALPLYALLLLLPLVATYLLAPSLNGWMLGELYARNLGVHVRRLRLLLLLLCGLLAAVTTAYCGPITFIGLSMPHVARLLLRTDDHRHLLPATALMGALCALLCLLLSTLLPTSGGVLPLNALTPFFGVPVIVYVLVGRGGK
jgi:iron complex transport system permease protein